MTATSKKEQENESERKEEMREKKMERGKEGKRERGKEGKREREKEGRKQTNERGRTMVNHACTRPLLTIQVDSGKFFSHVLHAQKMGPTSSFDSASFLSSLSLVQPYFDACCPQQCRERIDKN